MPAVAAVSVADDGEGPRLAIGGNAVAAILHDFTTNPIRNLIRSESVTKFNS